MTFINDMQFKIVKNTDEFEKILKIREEVFVKEQQIPYEVEFAKDNYLFQHFYVLSKNEIIATARMRFEGDTAYISRFAVKKSFRKKRVGSVLLQNLCDYAKEKNLKKIQLHAQFEYRNFYLNNDFHIVSDTYYEANILHVTMENNL